MAGASGSGRSQTDINRSPTGDALSLRRGHSDGEVFSTRNGGESRGPPARAMPDDRETMLEFLQQTASTLGEDRTQVHARLMRQQASWRQARERQQRRLEGLERMRRLSSPAPSALGTAQGTSHTPAAPERSHGPTPHNPLDRPLPTPPVQAPSSRQPDFVVPRWQPDHEVAECAVCHTPFSFLRRKHHCRRCGRVVCNACSPHRITIPRPLIVRPPEQQHALQAIIDLTGGDEPSTSPTEQSTTRLVRNDSLLEGGEEVRLCNPCVPDPNPIPHAYATPASGALDRTRGSTAFGAPSSRHSWTTHPGTSSRGLVNSLQESADLQPPPPPSYSSQYPQPGHSYLGPRAQAQDTLLTPPLNPSRLPIAQPSRPGDFYRSVQTFGTFTNNSGASAAVPGSSQSSSWTNDTYVSRFLSQHLFLSSPLTIYRHRTLIDYFNVMGCFAIVRGPQPTPYHRATVHLLAAPDRPKQPKYLHHSHLLSRGPRSPRRMNAPSVTWNFLLKAQMVMKQPEKRM